MKKGFTLLYTIIFLVSTLVLSAQEVTESTLTIDPIKTVNFKAKADFELLNPLPKVKRFVEQGEDHERDFEFIPKPITGDVQIFNVPPIAPVSPQSRSASPAPSVSFNGTLDNGTLIPPDIRGAVGPNHVMETTNQEFKVFTKTGALVSTLSIVNFFSATGGSGYFDPHILYDPTNSRWLVCIAGTHSSGNGGVFIGVSQTTDPTGGWYVYSFDGIGNSTDFLDYPLLGYNANWVVVTANDFLTNGVTGKVYVMNRSALYGGSLSTVTVYTDANVFSLAPAQTYDASQTILYMVENWNGNSGGNGYVRIGKITGTATSPSYTAGSLLAVNQPWSNSTIDVPQSGSTRKIDAGDSRAGNAVYINGSLWFCQTAFLPASSPSRSAAQWWQINPAGPTLQQFGRVDGGSSSALMYFYPGIAVNSNNDVMLGHCQTSSSSYASASYSMRQSTDAANTLQTPYTYKSGVASYYKTYGGTRNRWGDYTGSCIDPSNGSFWNFNEWANTNNKWGTAVANVSLTPVVPCSIPTGLSTTSIGNNTATFNWSAVSGAVSYNVQYRISGAGSWTTANAVSTSYNATGLSLGTLYEWQVQTVCSSGSSSFTSSQTFTTTGSSPCPSPSSLTSSSVTATTATLSWAAAAGAVSYNVQYRIIGSASWTQANTLGTSYNASGLTPSSDYEWHVQTVCSSSSSDFTTLFHFSTTALETCTDNFESNNSTGAATTLATNTTVNGLITPSTDVDWFKFTTSTPNTRVKVDLTSLPDDYDMALYRGTRTRVALSQNSGTTNEQIIYNTNKAYTYYLQVYGYNGATSATDCYDLRVSVASTSWAPEYAAAVSGGDKDGNIDLQPVLTVYPNPATDELNVDFMSVKGGGVTLSVYNLIGQKLISETKDATEGMNTVNIKTENLSRGEYILEINDRGQIQKTKFNIAR